MSEDNEIVLENFLNSIDMENPYDRQSEVDYDPTEMSFINDVEITIPINNVTDIT